MSEFITLSLLLKQPPAIEAPRKMPQGENSRLARNALLALLAANIFVISGALCFGYFFFNY